MTAIDPKEYEDWVLQNFPSENEEIRVFGGLCEEVGEVMRCVVKRGEGGMRPGDWDAELRKEIGDVYIKLMDVCRFEGLDLDSVAADRWAVIRKRCWRDGVWVRDE